MLKIGSLVYGKYKILNEVGRGGMSVVYLAMNEKANKQWAIKEVRKDGIRDFEVVENREVSLPEELRGFVKCANPKCITNNEPMATLFHVVDKENCVIRCHYCEKEQNRNEIEII